MEAVELFFDLLSHCLVVRIVGVEVMTPRFVEVDRFVRSRQSSEHTVGVEKIPPFATRTGVRLDCKVGSDCHLRGKTLDAEMRRQGKIYSVSGRTSVVWVLQMVVPENLVTTAELGG